MKQNPKDEIIEHRAAPWQALPGSQYLALNCPCDEILYHGSRGPGKTDAQLMRFRRNVGEGYGKFWRGVIFDREYKNLDDLISKSTRWFYQYGDGAKFLASKSDYRWVWPTGEELLFRQIKRKEDYWNYHGQEFPFIGWNELTKYPTSELYDLMMSCNRSSFRPQDYPLIDEKTGKITGYLPEIPLQVFSTTNSYGAGRNWVKRRFIDTGEAGDEVPRTINVYNPRTKMREDIVKVQTHIFGSYRENKFLSPEYVANLESDRDPNRRRAWLLGDWNVVSGGAFDDLWSDALILPRFKIPASWYIDRSFDWGSTHPFSVAWWAEANGEEVELPDGRIFCPPPGTLIRFAEWYGSNSPGENKGLKMSAGDIARGIVEREKALIEQGWITRTPAPGPADNQIFDRPQADVESIAKKMSDEGIEWEKSDKSPGSRMNGFQLFRDRLEASQRGEGAGIYFMRHCQAAITLIPSLPRDDVKLDDVDTEAEDHNYDDLRYRVLAGNNRLATSINVNMY
jgi:hypothetical protein